MTKDEVEEFLRTLCSTIFCKYCNENIPRQEIGHHHRQNYHIENLHSSSERGTYEDLLEYHELYVTAKEYIWLKDLSDIEYAAIQSLSSDSSEFFEGEAK